MKISRFLAALIALVSACSSVATPLKQQLAPSATPTTGVFATVVVELPSTTPTAVVVVAAVAAVPTDTPTRVPPTFTPTLVTSTPWPPTLTPPPTYTRTPTRPPASPTLDYPTYYVKSQSAVNLRDQANTSSEVITKLPPGTGVIVTGEVTGQIVSGSAMWYQVAYGVDVGYVHSSLISKTPVAQVQQQVFPTGAGKAAPRPATSIPVQRPAAPPTSRPVQVQPTQVPPPPVPVIQPTAAPPSNSGGGPFRCVDGTISNAAHRQGACSHHGGIAG